jgi:hypothetical protein
MKSLKQHKKLQPQEQPQKPLSQEQLMAWWPFTRLDPKLFPKPNQRDLSQYEESLI